MSAVITRIPWVFNEKIDRSFKKENRRLPMIESIPEEDELHLLPTSSHTNQEPSKNMPSINFMLSSLSVLLFISLLFCLKSVKECETMIVKSQGDMLVFEVPEKFGYPETSYSIKSSSSIHVLLHSQLFQHIFMESLLSNKKNRIKYTDILAVNRFVEMCNLGIDSNGNFIAKDNQTKKILQYTRVKVVCGNVEIVNLEMEHSSKPILRKLQEGSNGSFWAIISWFLNLG